MWMLSRGSALDASGEAATVGAAYTARAGDGRVLASCPDSPERGDRWKWTIRLTGAEPHAGVDIDHDPELVTITRTTVEGPGEKDLDRATGRQFVIVPVAGACQISIAGGPWARDITPGDVYIAEGEEPETLRISAADARTRVEAIEIAAADGSPLRWVP